MVNKESQGGKELIQATRANPNISANEILRKIYQALDPDGANKIVKTVEFPHGVNSNQINIKLSPEADTKLIKSQLGEIEGIILKE